MANITTQLVVRTSTESMGGLWIGVIKTGTATIADTANLADPTYGNPGIRRVLWATINGTGNEGRAHCTLGGTSVVTVGSVSNIANDGVGTENALGLSDGEMLVIAVEKY